MANSFRPLKGSCSFCNGARSDCRENTHNGLIHCRHDVSTVAGFRFVGTDALGFNMWAVDDGRERNEASWSEMRQQQAADRERRFREEAERFAQSLDATARNRNIVKISSQLGLTTRHRQNLRDRGLTDAQIDQGKYFSIAPWQEVTGINPRLAGVDLYGRKLLIGQSGIAIPIRDVEGRLIGWQTRFDDTKGGKYRWPTSQSKKRPNGATAHLQNGELPITCCRPLGYNSSVQSGHPDTTQTTRSASPTTQEGVRFVPGSSRGEIKDSSIGLAEGFLKPDIAAHKQGQIFIGAAGANFTSSPQQFKAYLDELSSILNTKTVTLYPDAGAIANNAVMRHYERAIQMATDWGYSARVAWWGQVDKSHPDIDELPDVQEIAYLTPEEFLGMGNREQTGHSFAGLSGWILRLKRRFEHSKQSPWGFGRKGEVEVEQAATAHREPGYPKGHRIDTWKYANHRGCRQILDTSDTGLGKSYDAGRLTPEMFPDARQVIYVSREHRNPTTNTLFRWHDLEARHKGLYRDAFGKLRRVDKAQPYVVPPNCGRNEVIGALRAKNIPGADTAKLVCTTCPHFEPCRAGAVYGFLNQRAEALKEPRLRAHPDSLPSPEDYDYQQVVLIWEEAREAIKRLREIKVRDMNVSRTIADLSALFPDIFDALRPLLNTLHRHLSGKVKQPNKYGWDDAQVREVLPSLGEIDLEAIREALKQNPERILNGGKEYGVDSADLPLQVRKKFTERDDTTAERIQRELALNWLPDFLDVLLGNEVGSLTIQYGVLTVTLGDERNQRIAQAASCNIYLDATATEEEIARLVGVEESEIFVTQQATEELDNLEIIQVKGVGRLGPRERSDYCQGRIHALVAQFQKEATGDTARFDFKFNTSSGDGTRHWWVDDRGINDLETCQTLILTGTPCRNLNGLEAEFTALYGRRPRSGTQLVRYPVTVTGQSSPDIQPYFEMEVSADLEFRNFVRRDILATYRQAIGRLRARRRAGEKLRVIIIADYPLDFPVTLKKASDITLDAASKTERVVLALLEAGRQVLALGKKLTQGAVSELTKRLDPNGKGYSQQHISRYWRLLISLLDPPYSKMSKTDPPPPDPAESEWISREYLPMLAESPPGELLQGVFNTFSAYGQRVFKVIWNAAPATAQIKILSSLMLLLPQGELQAFAAALGVDF